MCEALSTNDPKADEVSIQGCYQGLTAGCRPLCFDFQPSKDKENVIEASPA